jgi:UDP-N-acetylglucosamine:LPS N-acetylglucosamine transferase
MLARDEDDVVEKVHFLSGHQERSAQMTANASTLGMPAAAQTICERVLSAIR